MRAVRRSPLSEQFVPPPEPLAPLIGKTVADITFDDLEGKEVSASSLEKNAVVIDFWFAGCVPCQQNTPALQEPFEHFAENERFAMYAVSVDDRRVAAEVLQQTLRNWGGKLEILRDTQDVGSRHLGAQGWPTTVLLGPRGKIHRTSRGAQESYQDWHGPIDKLLAGEDVAGEMLAEYRADLMQFESELAAATLDNDESAIKSEPPIDDSTRDGISARGRPANASRDEDNN